MRGREEGDRPSIFGPSISALASLPLHLPAHVIPLRNKMGTDPAFPARSIQFGI